MESNNKIYLSKYLKDLNEGVSFACSRREFSRDDVSILTCKEISEKIGVTSATLSNLSTNSKFFLLWQISEIIFDSYYSFFCYEREKSLKEYPDESLPTFDPYFILRSLTLYYSDEWINS